LVEGFDGEIYSHRVIKNILLSNPLARLALDDLEELLDLFWLVHSFKYKI
jgi:hypothetical protein